MQIRLARLEDEEQLFELLVRFHEECGYYDLNHEKAYFHMRNIVDSGHCYLLCNDAGTIKGSVGLQVVRDWWSDNKRVQDTWFYIDKDFRSLDSFKTLLDAAVKFAEGIECVFTLLLYADGAKRKRVLFSKYLKECMEGYEIRYIGGAFVADHEKGMNQCA